MRGSSKPTILNPQFLRETETNKIQHPIVFVLMVGVSFVILADPMKLKKSSRCNISSPLLVRCQLRHTHMLLEDWGKSWLLGTSPIKGSNHGFLIPCAHLPVCCHHLLCLIGSNLVFGTTGLLQICDEPTLLILAHKLCCHCLGRWLGLNKRPLSQCPLFGVSLGPCPPPRRLDIVSFALGRSGHCSGKM